jgi:hypothetical protein
MSLWKVRIAMPSDPASQEWLAAALAGQRVLALLPPSDEDPTGEVIIELPRDDSLGVLLSDLHVISPQVYVSHVSDPPALPDRPVPQQARRQGVREPALVAAGGPASLRDQIPV